MFLYVLKRLLWMIPVVLGVAIIIFTIMYFTPGDPAAIILGSEALEEDLVAKREELGLDRPYHVRLFDYLYDVFVHFDFGTSYIYGNEVTEQILERLPRTMALGLISIAVSLIVGIPLGVIAAVYQDGIGDRLSMLVALLGVSMPQFWIGLLLVLFFSLKLDWFPASGIGGVEYYILPCIANSFGGIAAMARQCRSSMLEVIRSDYITTASAKGLSKRTVILRHALPNSLIPVLTLAGTNFARMIGGAVVIETVFGMPGMGLYLVNGVNNRDYPVVQGCVIIMAITFSVVMLAVDLLYAFVDPRIKARYVVKKRRKSA